MIRYIAPQHFGGVMGDCAVVIFHSPEGKEVSPAVYLHYHGGLVLSFLEKALPQMKTGDAGYACARFVGTCHEHIPPVDSLGVMNLPGTPEHFSVSDRAKEHARMLAKAKRFDWGDRGVFLVDVDAWRVEHAGAHTSGVGEDTGDGFDLQEDTELRSVNGVVPLPAKVAGAFK